MSKKQFKGVFKRVEKKYLLTTEQYNALLDQIADRFTADEYGKYTINNIYYDTPDFELIRHSLDKPVYKEKLRLRSYGIPKSDDTVFLEIKKKYKGIVYKRRAAMTLREATAYLSPAHIHPQQDGQILSEIDWVLQYYGLQPRVCLSYDRTALIAKENDELRVTFDTNIRWRQSALDLSRGTWGNPLLGKNEILMEIKIPGALPTWFSLALAELHIFPTSYSKYGTCYRRNLADFTRKGERSYA